MILSGGFNVYPAAVEGAIYEHPDVAECIVVGIPDEYRGQAAKAYVSLRAGAKPFTLEELRGVPRGPARQARDAGGARDPGQPAAQRGGQAAALKARLGHDPSRPHPDSPASEG
jgi:hypothetical protein